MKHKRRRIVSLLRDLRARTCADDFLVKAIRRISLLSYCDSFLFAFAADEHNFAEL
jgi:hypothetical protein